jgi:hypothetical protein
MMFYTVGVVGVSTGVSTGADSTTGASISTQLTVSSFHVYIFPSVGIAIGASHKYVDVFFVHEAKG